MAFIVSDRVQETSTSVGTGTVSLAGAVTGYQSFAVIGNGNDTYYTIADQSGSNWEVGVGTYYSANTSLSRTTILASSSSNAAVSFPPGTKSVFVTYPAEKAIYADPNDLTTVTNFASANVAITGGTISGVTYVGLGTMSLQNANNVNITNGAINVTTLSSNGANITGGLVTGVDFASSNVTITGGTINNVSLSNISGLGTMATQNANAVAITGGNATVTNLTAQTITATGNATSQAFSTVNITEPTTIVATGAANTVNFDLTTQSVYYDTANATANWTINFRGSSTATLDSVLANANTITCTFMATQGATAYYNSAIQVDGTGTGVTTKWQTGTAPTSGNTNSVDVYNYVVTKTSATPTYTVLASVTKFA